MRKNNHESIFPDIASLNHLNIRIISNRVMLLVSSTQKITRIFQVAYGVIHWRGEKVLSMVSSFYNVHRPEQEPVFLRKTLKV